MCFFGNIGNDTYRKLRSLNVISYLASSTGKSDTASKLTELVVKLLFLLSTLSLPQLFSLSTLMPLWPLVRPCLLLILPTPTLMWEHFLSRCFFDFEGF